MFRGRGGTSTYLGYGALTLILMYVLFLYNATKQNLDDAETRVGHLTKSEKELYNELASK